MLIRYQDEVVTRLQQDMQNMASISVATQVGTMHVNTRTSSGIALLRTVITQASNTFPHLEIAILSTLWNPPSFEGL